MSITLVHHFHTQISAVDRISPSSNHATLRINNRLVKVETIQVKRHPQYGLRSLVAVNLYSWYAPG